MLKIRNQDSLDLFGRVVTRGDAMGEEIPLVFDDLEKKKAFRVNSLLGILPRLRSRTKKAFNVIDEG